MPRCQTRDDVLHQLWTSGHPPIQVFTPYRNMNQRAHSLLFGTILLPSGIRLWNCLPEYIAMRASRGFWQFFISQYNCFFFFREGEKNLNLHQLFYRHLFTPQCNLVNSSNTTMLQSGLCTVREEAAAEKIAMSP